jgi:hypothetical protein
MTQNEKIVTDLQPGDYVMHMLDIKCVSWTAPVIECPHTYVSFRDGTYDEIENFRSLRLANDIAGDTLEKKKFTYAMETHRGVTLSMAGFPNETILPLDLVDLLDAYEKAYQKMYIEKWGEVGPRGSVLRMETEEETNTREVWENATREYWNEIDSDTITIEVD